MKNHILALLLTPLLAISTQAAAPEFTLEAFRGNLKMPLVGVIVKAPPKHHFNIKAPMSAKTVGTQISLAPVISSDQEIRFEVEDPSISPHDSVEVSAYLCDDAKTFCVKKMGSIGLASAAPAPIRNKVVRPDVELPNAKPAAVKEEPVTPAFNSTVEIPVTPIVKRKVAKDQHGFWNDPATAQKLAEKQGKPILIDFYGIWCPPCNLFNETVFPTPQFKAMAQKFILLKVDADENDSWSIKSKFKIGGYPTIVFAKANLDEIDRVVGFFPRDEFVQQMKEAYADRDKSYEERVVLNKAKYLDGIQRMVEVKYEQKDFKETLRYAQEGLTLKPDDQFFRIMKLTVLSNEEPRILKQADNGGFLKSIWENRAQASAAVLLRFQDLINSHFDVLRSEQVLWAADALDHLKSRVNEKTLHLDGQEMSIADLDALRVDIYEHANNDDRAKQAVKDTIASYRRLMKLFNGEKSRGFNLELAYFLGKDGQVAEATAIYEGFMKQYPKEFTYFFAAARHFEVVVKDLKRAREVADQALKYSYGDNKLRTMTRLLSIRVAQGETKEGVAQAREILGQVPNYDGLSVRTGRYVTALKAAIDKTGEGKK